MTETEEIAAAKAPIDYDKQAASLKTDYAEARNNLHKTVDLLRPERDELDKQINELVGQFQKKWENLLAFEKATLEKLDKLEADLRNLGISYYKATGNKTLDANIGIRIQTTFKYETEKAIEWAQKNAPVCVTTALDKKTFEMIAVAQKLDFVTKDETEIGVLKGMDKL